MTKRRNNTRRKDEDRYIIVTSNSKMTKTRGSAFLERGGKSVPTKKELLDKGNIFCRDMKMILMERLVSPILVRRLPSIYAISSSD
jgi:hypothetical protein